MADDLRTASSKSVLAGSCQSPDQHRESYRRAWIERMTAEYQHISDAIIADLPRINALEELGDDDDIVL